MTSNRISKTFDAVGTTNGAARKDEEEMLKYYEASGL